MIDMKIFGLSLQWAFDIEVLLFQESPLKRTSDMSYESMKVLHEKKEKSCYILTNAGDMEVYVTQVISHAEDKPKVSFSVIYKNNIQSAESHLIQALYESQLESEIFLNYDNAEEVSCSCESLK